MLLIEKVQELQAIQPPLDLTEMKRRIEEWKTSTGYKVTAPEGFVAIDSLKGGAVKLVDRLEFSMQNFNAAKNWTK